MWFYNSYGITGQLVNIINNAHKMDRDRECFNDGISYLQVL
jgi:hypothetical protein